MHKKKRFKIRHILVLLFSVYICYTLIIQQFKLHKLANQEAELQTQVRIAVEKRDELKRQIELLHTDSYIEKLAREELGLVKPGELIYKK